MSMLVKSYILENTAKVIHFTSEIKPWNFYFLQNEEWRQNFDGNAFSLWTRALRESKSKLEAGGLLSSKELAPDRITHVCEKSIKESYGRQYRRRNQFSVIFSLKRSSGDDARIMSKLRHYSGSRLVDRIFIVNQGTISDGMKRWIERQKRPMIIVDQPFPTPNNRFNPIQGLSATSVFIVDDTVRTTEKEAYGPYEFAGS